MKTYLKKLSLVERFFITAAVITIVGALSFGHLINHIMGKNTLEYAIHYTTDLVNENIKHHFNSSDLIGPKTGDEYGKIANKIDHLSFGGNIHRIVIWNNDTVIWSSEKKLVNMRFPDNNALKNALEGGTSAELIDPEIIRAQYTNDSAIEYLMELYVPLNSISTKEVKVVLEIYQDMTPFYAAISKNKQTVWMWTIIGSVAATFIFLGIIWNASKRIETQTKEITLSKQDWEDTFDTITDLITIHDNNCNIIRANRTAMELLKLPDLTANTPVKCFKYYHNTDKPPAECPNHICERSRESNVMEVLEPFLNRFVEIRSIPRIDKNNNYLGLIHVVRDISKKRNDEELIQTHLNHLNALRSIDKAIIGSIDLRITLDIFLEHATNQLHIDAASILLLNHKAQTLEYFLSKGFRSKALKYTRLRLGEGNAGRAAVEKRIITISNLRENIHSFANSEAFTKEDFTTYFAVPLIAKGQVKGILELFNRSMFVADPDWIEFLEAIADQGAIAIDNATMFDELQRSNVELSLAYDNTIEGWSRAMDLRDKETEGHSQRVTDMTLRIAREMGIKDEDLVHIRRGALLHDMGKMGIPDNILLKPGSLTDDEWQIMRRHPEYAYEMLSPIGYLRPALDILYYHHEKWDGSGYPKGLKGNEIPLSARIFAVVDVWDALSSDRPYRNAWPREKVLEHIGEQSGTHFDPRVVDTFLKTEASISDYLLKNTYVKT